MESQRRQYDSITDNNPSRTKRRCEKATSSGSGDGSNSETSQPSELEFDERAKHVMKDDGCPWGD